MKKKMKLIDFIREQNDDTIIYVGAKSQYFFCGVKADFFKDIAAIEILTERNVQSDYAQTKSSIDDAKKGLKYTEGSLFEYADKLIHLGESLKFCQRKLEEMDKTLSPTYVPLFERKVIDVYRTLDKEKICVLIEGYEKGTFWDIDEYKKAREAGLYIAIKEKENDAYEG